jgi:hydroxymethylglutaryl-CoA lyase
MNYPKKVTIGDITVRDGFQHEEKFIPTAAKLWLSEQLIIAGFKHIEVSNFGNPRGMPQFRDADELFTQLRNSKKVKHLLDDVKLTAITIRERAIERAISAYKAGIGPDRILVMVSTSESHQKINSGLSTAEYFNMCEEWIPKAREAGMKVNGTVSTIWGCPVEGPMEMSKAIEFTKRWFEIGATDVEHADHDGSASPDRVYKYYSMLMDAFGSSDKHIVHFHTTRGWGMANVLAALQVGMTNYESTMGGIGGQPANFVSGVPVSGTGTYYYKDPNIVGLVSTEDMVVMMDEMGIDTGVDVDKVLEIGAMVERIVGRRLRSESVHNGRIPTELSGRK